MNGFTCSCCALWCISHTQCPCVCFWCAGAAAGVALPSRTRRTPSLRGDSSASSHAPRLPACVSRLRVPSQLLSPGPLFHLGPNRSHCRRVSGVRVRPLARESLSVGCQFHRRWLEPLLQPVHRRFFEKELVRNLKSVWECRQLVHERDSLLAVCPQHCTVTHTLSPDFHNRQSK